MKHLLRSLVVMFVIILAPATAAYAGTINDNEAEVLEAAKGQFEYDGKFYEVDDAYLEKLSDFLASEEVDLSEEDKDQILAMVNDYIITGVAEGYLVPIDAVPSEEQGTVPSEKPGSKPSTTPIIEPASTPTAAPAAESASTPATASAAELSPTPSTQPTSTPVVETTITPTAIPEVTVEDDSNINNNNATAAVTAGDSSGTATAEGNRNILGIDPKYLVLIALGIAALIVIGFIITKNFIIGNTSHKHGAFHGASFISGGYTDIHTHILPGVDDGASNMEETQKMLKLAVDQGISAIIATPHFVCGAKNTSARRLHEIMDQVRTEAVKLDAGFQLSLGNELFYSESIIEALQSKEALTLAGSRYVLVEFSPGEEYRTLYRGLGNLVRAGYAPILAHMERYQCLDKKIERILEIIELGCYIQINCTCLIGGSFHRKANYFYDLMNQGLIHFIATDCHDSIVRTPRMASAVDALRSKVDEEILERILIENPRKIIQNIFI